MALALQIEDLYRDFDDVRALDGVSFDAPPGAVVVLLGHNGAGKTTLLRLINGLLHPSAGSVCTLGLDPVAHGQQVRQRTGVLTEYPALDDFLTVQENLRAYGTMYGLTEEAIDRRVQQLLPDLGLVDRVDTRTRHLSAGLRQRAALARALLHEPDLLLLDEPTSNLDPLAARNVRDLVVRESRERGATVVVSTHNLAEASAIADRVVVLQSGRVLATGPLEDLTGVQHSARVRIDTSPEHFAAAATLAKDLAAVAEHHPATSSLVLPADTHAIPAIVEAFVMAGIPILAAVPETPSLEDVYVALHAPAPSKASKQVSA